MKARSSRAREHIEDYFYQQNDACMLRLFEAFLESAPQLCLQFYIILCTEKATWLTIISAVISLVALGWAVAAYSHALRRAYCFQYRFSSSALFIQTLWHMCIAAARVAAIVAFCSAYKAWIFLFMGLHWMLMTLWVVLQKTDFCPTRAEEVLFNAVVGVIYCFCFFNLKEGSTRWRMVIFYSIMLLENVIMIAVWYPFRPLDAWYNHLLMVIAFGAFLLGISSLILYYSYCHPSGPLSCWKAKLTFDAEDSKKDAVSTFKQRKSTAQLHPGLQPNHTSTAQLPRRNLLKSSHLQLPIAFREAATPMLLTPIKPHQSLIRLAISPKHLNFPNTTLPINDTSAFQHYSIDASVGIEVNEGERTPYCQTLEVTGISLSCYDATSCKHGSGALAANGNFHPVTEMDELHDDKHFSCVQSNHKSSDSGLATEKESSYMPQICSQQRFSQSSSLSSVESVRRQSSSLMDNYTP